MRLCMAMVMVLTFPAASAAAPQAAVLGGEQAGWSDLLAARSAGQSGGGCRAPGNFGAVSDRQAG